MWREHLIINSFLRRKNYVTNDRYWKALRTTRLIQLSWRLIYYFFRRVRWYDKYLQFLKAWVRIWNYYNWIVIENVFARQHITENVLQRLIRFFKKNNFTHNNMQITNINKLIFSNNLERLWFYYKINRYISSFDYKIPNFIPT